MSFNITKKAITLALAATMVAGTAAIVAVPAQAAAVKQGATCLTNGAKSGKYTCGTNPASTATKLVWLTANCVNNGTAYGVAQSALTTSAGVLAQLNTAISTNQAELTNAQNALTAANAKQYFIYTDQTTKTPVNATGLAAAITALQARLTNDQTKLAAATSVADKAAWTRAITQRSALINVLSHEQTILTNNVKNATANLANLNTQLTALNGPGGGYSAAQAAYTSAKKAVATACKAGL
jgi:hypothetical protein